MDKFIQSLLTNADKDNFINEWNSSSVKAFEGLNEIKNCKNKNEAIIKALVLYANKSHDLNNYYPKATIEKSLKVEENLLHVFNYLLNELESSSLNNDQILSLINSIVTKTHFQYYNGSALNKLFNRMRNSIPTFNNTQCTNLLKQLEVNIYENILSNASKVNNAEEYISKVVYIWRSNFDFVLNNLSDKQFSECLVAIQHLYEFGIVNCSNRSYCPYSGCCDLILRTKDHAIDSKLLYSTVLTNDSQFVKLLELLKKILIVDNAKYNEATITDFVRELGNVIKYEAQKPNSLHEKHYKFIYETIFDIYSKAKANNSLSICRMFLREIVDLLQKSKKIDVQFQLWLITKLTELSTMVKNQNQNGDYLKLFAEFCSSLKLYFILNCTNKTLAVSFVNLVIQWLSLSSELEFLKMSADVLRKNGFYLFKDYIDKLTIIVKTLVDFANKFYIEYADDENKLESYYNELKNCIEYLSEQIKSHPPCIKAIQSIILNEICDKAIKEDIQDSHYYMSVKSFVELIDFKLYSNNKEDLKKLKETFKLSVQPKIIESIQPDINPFYYSRNLFYLTFFRAFANVYDSRSDIANLIENEVRSLLTQIDNINSYDDAINPGNMNINFYILLAFSLTIVRQSETQKSLIKHLTPIMLRMYETDEYNTSIESLFHGFLTLCYAKNADLLAEYASKLWQIHFNNNNNKYLQIVQTILPLNISVFLKEYKNEFFDKILCDPFNKLSENYSMLQLLTKQAPECFLEKDDSGQIRLVSIIKNVIETQSGLLIYYVIDIIQNVAVNVKSLSNEIEKVFECRTNIIDMLKLGDRQKIDELKQLATSNNLEVMTYIFPFTNIYTNMANKIKDDKNFSKCRKLLEELIAIFNKSDDQKSSVQILTTIQNIGATQNKLFLLKEKRKFFENLKNSDGNIKQTATYICDLIDGRNLETIDTKVETNTNNINKLNQDVKKTDKQVSNIKATVKKQELNVTNLKKDVGNINDKLVTVDERLDDQDKHLEVLDDKTLLNVPLWSRDIAPKLKDEWVLIAKRLNFTQKDINAWQTQADPFMAVLQEWYTINKSSDATNGLLKVLKELNKTECIQIIENSLNDASKTLNEEDDDTFTQRLVNSPPEIFISYQWAVKEKAELLKKYLEQSKYDCWLDIGQMGGGVIRNDRIDKGMRAAKVIVCFITSDYAKDDTAVKQLNLAVQLGKPVLPLLLEKLDWPPPGSVGPILSEYLFIRFFQKPKEKTNDERYWPVDKYDELIMQLKQLVPSKQTVPAPIVTNKAHPLVFISYQWDKQKQIIKLYEKLTSFGLTCWLDIKEMAGGDSLYEKIDTGIRNCNVVISCITNKYSLSANCRKEVSLANSVNKPLIPILLESGMAYPPKGPMGPVFATIDYVDFTVDINEQDKWNGVKSEELLVRIKDYIPDDVYNDIDSKIQVMKNSKACVIS